MLKITENYIIDIYCARTGNSRAYVENKGVGYKTFRSTFFYIINALNIKYEIVSEVVHKSEG